VLDWGTVLLPLGGALPPLAGVLLPLAGALLPPAVATAALEPACGRDLVAIWRELRPGEDAGALRFSAALLPPTSATVRAPFRVVIPIRNVEP